MVNQTHTAPQKRLKNQPGRLWSSFETGNCSALQQEENIRICFASRMHVSCVNAVNNTDSKTRKLGCTKISLSSLLSVELNRPRLDKLDPVPFVPVPLFFLETRAATTRRWDEACLVYFKQRSEAISLPWWCLAWATCQHPLVSGWPVCTITKMFCEFVQWCSCL